MELFRDFAADTLRDLDAFVKCHAADGDKRNHVRRADSRMLALVLREINMAQRDCDAAHGGPTDRLGRTHDGDDRPIVIRVHFPPEQIDTADRSDRAHDRVHNFRPSSFAEIRHAFHDFVHKNLLSRFTAADERGAKARDYIQSNANRPNVVAGFIARVHPHTNSPRLNVALQKLTAAKYGIYSWSATS